MNIKTIVIILAVCLGSPLFAEGPDDENKTAKLNTTPNGRTYDMVLNSDKTGSEEEVEFRFYWLSDTITHRWTRLGSINSIEGDKNQKKDLHVPMPEQRNVVAAYRKEAGSWRQISIAADMDAGRYWTELKSGGTAKVEVGNPR